MRASKLAVLLVGFVMCSGLAIGGWWGTRSATDPDSAYRVVTTPIISPSELDEIRANPTTLLPLFEQDAEQFRDELGPAFADLSPAELRVAYCTMLAHALAPFGGSTCSTFPEMLRADTLNCGNYGLLTIELSRLFPDAEYDYVVRLVGWDGGVVGNHQMLFLERDNGSLSLVLDPSIGLVGRATFNHVASGQPLPAEHLVVFRRRDDLVSFEKTVGTALHRGDFRPTDLLYYFEDIEHLRKRYGKPTEWPTPGGRIWRERNPWPPAKNASTSPP